MRWINRTLAALAIVMMAGSASATMIEIGAVVKNNANAAADFTIDFFPEVGDTLPAIISQIQGSIGVTATDQNNDGVTLTGQIFYSATIDGQEVLQLLKNVNLVGAAGATVIDAETSPPVAINPAIAGAQAAKVTIKFTLSAGDNASFTGQANIVPEPSTVLLFGSGLMGLIAMGRRRKA